MKGTVGEARYMISMNLYDDMFELGANKHFALETPLKEALVEFFNYYRMYDNNRWHTEKGRSILKIELLDVVIDGLDVYLPVRTV